MWLFSVPVALTFHECLPRQWWCQVVSVITFNSDNMSLSLFEQNCLKRTKINEKEAGNCIPLGPIQILYRLLLKRSPWNRKIKANGSKFILFKTDFDDKKKKKNDVSDDETLETPFEIVKDYSGYSTIQVWFGKQVYNWFRYIKLDCS